MPRRHLGVTLYVHAESWLPLCQSARIADVGTSAGFDSLRISCNRRALGSDLTLATAKVILDCEATPNREERRMTDKTRF